jgi:hypothetical protein
MGDAELKSQIQVVVDASIVDIAMLPSSQSSILTRLHAGYFKISLTLDAKALPWKITIEPTNDSQAPLTSTAFVLLWCLALLVLITLSLLYIRRCFFHFQLVKAEFLHPIGVNFLYVPWISWLFMLKSAPLINLENLTYQVLWLGWLSGHPYTHLGMASWH